METTYLMVMDSSDSANIYFGLQFYSRNASNSKEVAFGELKADRKEHKWEEETLEFLELQTKVKLTFYTFPSAKKRELPRHTLELEISGDNRAREATIKKLEAVTGINISRYKI